MDALTELFAQLDQTFLGISLGHFSAAIATLICAFFVKKLIGQFFIRVLQPIATRTRGDYDDRALGALRKPAEFLAVIAGLYIAVELLQIPGNQEALDLIVKGIVKLLIAFDIAWALYNLVDVLDSLLQKWATQTETDLDDHLLPFIRKSLRIFIIVMALIMGVQNLGYSISGLLASLGIGGLAIALAAKDALSNIFGSIMILLDRPFAIGDWVKADDLEGTIEEVGFRSTKIRTFAKTQITVPNSVLMNMSIDNFSRMPKRRIKMNVGVTYATSSDQMREAVGKIRQMLRDHPAIDQEFFLVNFTDFGASSLDIMVYCFTSTTVWQEYLDARQDVFLKIMDILEEMGLEIAFPSRTVYLEDITEEKNGLVTTD
ncbi:MAG TPA: mechanosensitive ion channel family protein [Geopsychrobacteraceae bacterium]|nr:mechanosensitive ion channel family protein [Geopsychrobacteraceae bacterium]